MRNALALLPMVVLGGAGAFAVVGTAAAEEPPPLVETVTVPELYQGHTAVGWAGSTALYKNRWLDEKHDGKLRARSIRRLRAANRARLHLGAHGLERAFLCIKQFEGAWTSATGNGYFGGMQMDRDFMRSYGAPFYEAWGTADRWPAGVQLAVAMRAYLSGRGFGPWPNTRRMCGL